MVKFTKYAQQSSGLWYAVTLDAKNANEAALRFAEILPQGYQYWAPEGFAPIGVQA